MGSDSDRPGPRPTSGGVRTRAPSPKIQNGFDMPPIWLSALRWAWRLGLVLTLAVLATLLLRWVQMAAEEDASLAMIGVLAAVLVAYALLIALPFVPGIEIGLTLMVLNGTAILPWVYGATVLGLLLAYLAGRHLPYAWLLRFFADLRMRRACALIERINPLPLDRRLALFRAQLPQRLQGGALRYRYLTLGILLNVPGNALLGGGGGLLLMAGISGLFSPRATLLTVVLAVLPGPLAFWILGEAAMQIFAG